MAPDARTRTASRILVPALMLICFGLRYFATTTVPMPSEEIGLIDLADRISLSPGAVNLPRHGWGNQLPGQLYIAKLGTLLLGPNIAGFRFMSVVLGTASCWIMFALVRRVWGVWPAMLSLFLLCFNGFHIGVSRFAIERTYLFFSLLAMYLFWRAVQEDRPWLMVAAGAIIGVGALVSKHTFLLLPAFAVYLALSKARRCWLARWAPYAGVLVAVAICLPLVCLNLQSAEGGESRLRQDLTDHIERLGGFGITYGSLALYVPPLYYKLSGRFSVYPTMSVVSGAILLGAVLYATFARRDEFSKLLLIVFWGFVGAFSLYSSPRPEFKWAATSLFAAVPLAGGALCQLFTRSRIYALLLLLPMAYIVGFAIWVANMSSNLYYSPLIPPGPVQIVAIRMMQGLLTGAQPQYEFSSILGSPLFPARYRIYYLNQYLEVAELANAGWMNPAVMRPALERAARIDPDHPDLPRLMRALERIEAADTQAEPEPWQGGRLFLRSPFELLGVPESEVQRQMEGMSFTYSVPKDPPPRQKPERDGP